MLKVAYFCRLADLQADGKWPDSDIDYATGCSGRAANWPAANHWVRISQSLETLNVTILTMCFLS